MQLMNMCNVLCSLFLSGASFAYGCGCAAEAMEELVRLPGRKRDIVASSSRALLLGTIVKFWDLVNVTVCILPCTHVGLRCNFQHTDAPNVWALA